MTDSSNTIFNQTLQKVFNQIDKDESKTISINQLPKALRQVGLTPTESQLEELSSSCILINDKFLDFKEFQKLAFACRASGVMSRDEVLSYFSGFDKEGLGFLTEDEVKKALCENGDKLTKSEVEVIIRDFKASDGKICIRDLVDGLLNGVIDD